MREAKIVRKTAETDIEVRLNIDGSGKSKIDTGIGFLDHMLTLFASHGKFDLSVTCKGDTEVDFHHSTEDIGIALGQAFSEALGDKKGIVRYGYMILPMDEALVMSAIDFSGRSFINFDVEFYSEKIGDFDTELFNEFFTAFADNAKCNLHISQCYGENAHHIAEAVFKSVARSIRQAVKIDADFADEIPSTKGVL